MLTLSRSFVALLALLVLAPASLRAQNDVPYDLRQIIAELDRYEKAVDAMVAGDRPVMKKYLKKINGIGSSLSKSPNKKHPKYKDCNTRYNNLKNACIKKGTSAPPKATFDEDRLRQIGEGAEKLRRQMGQIQVSQLADPAFQKRLEAAVVSFEKALAPFPATDPRVKKVAQLVMNNRRTYDAGMEAHRKNTAEAGYQEKFSAIYAKYQRKNLPPTPDFPMTPEEVTRYTALLNKLTKEELPKDKAWLDSLKGNPDVNKQRLSSMLYTVGSDLPRQFSESLVVLGRNLEAQLDVEKHFLKNVLETNPEDQNHIVNRLLGEGRYEQQMKNFARCENQLACLRAYDAAVGKTQDNKLKRDAAAERIGNAKKHFMTCMEKAYETVVFPKPLKQPDLLAIAQKVLKKKDSGVKGWERLEVTYPKKRKEKREGTLRYGTVTSTLTTYHYVWDEFGVTTAEKKGDAYYLFYNKIKLYHSGAENTNTDEWFLASRIQLSRIKPDNIKK
jgi:hypothetical protein